MHVKDITQNKGAAMGACLDINVVGLALGALQASMCEEEAVFDKIRNCMCR
jgi:hypothetical protein